MMYKSHIACSSSPVYLTARSYSDHLTHSLESSGVLKCRTHLKPPRSEGQRPVAQPVELTSPTFNHTLYHHSNALKLVIRMALLQHGFKLRRLPFAPESHARFLVMSPLL